MSMQIHCYFLPSPGVGRSLVVKEGHKTSVLVMDVDIEELSFIKLCTPWVSYMKIQDWIVSISILLIEHPL